LAVSMQPESSRPAARTPSVNFSDDMMYFRLKCCVRGAHIAPYTRRFH
jgi:hypothetical protein